MADERPSSRVLLVDDDRQEFVLLQGLLEVISERRFDLHWAANYDAGLKELRSGGYDVALIDYRLIDERSGLDLLKQAKQEGATLPMILLTGLWDTAIDLEAMRAGAADYLVKGQFGPDLLERCLRYAVERSRAVEALRDSEERYRTLVEGARAPFFTAGLDRRLVDTNQFAAGAFGRAAVEGVDLLELVHPGDRDLVASHFADAAAGGPPRQLEFRLAGPKERWWFAVLTRIRSRGRDSVACVAQDVTERRELESMYVQSEKMSAMGFLAAGVAHELNTPLSIILGSIPALGKKGKDVDSVQRAAQRCQKLVEQLLAFSRKDESRPEPFDLREAVRAAVSLVEPETKRRSLEVLCEVESRALPVKGHRNQLEQVVINLANNAIDAMAEGGRLEVRAKKARREGKPYARLEVIDTGRGIAPEHLERVTQPFFTTKPHGRGTGLGLSLASQIVAKHGGVLEIESRLNQGTRVSVYIPTGA